MSSRTRALAALLGTLSLLALIPTVAAAATRPTTFDLTLGQSCIAGEASDDATIHLTWRDDAGLLKRDATVHASPFGRWSRCFGDDPSWFDPDAYLEPGDRIKATIGSDTRRFVVPRLTLNPDRVKNKFHGKAPAGSTVRLEYPAALRGNGFEPPTTTVVTVTARDNGNWSYAPRDITIIGGWWSSIRWHDDHDRVRVDALAPYLVLRLGDARFSGVTRLGRTVDVAIEDAVTMAPKASGSAFVACYYDCFSGTLRDAEGDPVAVAAGDHLIAPTLASDADWIVPRVRARANPDTEVVKGRCFDAGTGVDSADVAILSPGGRYRGFAVTTASFEVDFSEQETPGFEPTNIRVGDQVLVRCMQSTGDWVEKQFVVT